LAWAQVVRLGWGVAQRVALRPIPPKPLPDAQRAYPAVSLVIPARNEAPVIGACLAAARAQRYPDLEIVVVDDGSEDETAAIVRRAGAEDGRVRLVPGQPLPPGWVGKCWALQQGAWAAQGDWLLFVDADTRLLPGAVGGAVDAARQRAVPVLSALTAQELPTVWERVVQPAVFGAIAEALPVVLVNDPRLPQFAIANGQFLLVRRDVYEAVGGHAAVRSEIAEDTAFARRVKALGWRYWLGDGRRLATTRMYTTPGALWEGWTKNLYRGARLLPWAIPLGTAYLTAVLIVPYLALYRAWRRRSAGLALAGAVQLSVNLLTRRLTDATFGVPARYTLAQPLGQVAFLVLLGASFWKVLTGRGVTWKGRRYYQ
jgi:cellulose synthase/poly-beta-1,6-N-acetylglucosamine synthase-like glycosyltransferase